MFSRPQSTSEAIGEAIAKGIIKLIGLILRLLWRGAKALFSSLSDQMSSSQPLPVGDALDLFQMAVSANERGDFKAARRYAQQCLAVLDATIPADDDRGVWHFTKATGLFALWSAESHLDPEPDPANFSDIRDWKVSAHRRLECLRGHLESAAEHIETAIKANPPPPDAQRAGQLIYWKLGLNLAHSDLHNRAYHALKRSIALTSDPATIEDLKQVGSTAEKAQQMADFETLAEGLIAQCPNQMHLRRGAASAYWSAAIAIYTDKSGPKEIDLRTRLITRAAEHMELVTANNSDANLLFQLGRIYHAQETCSGALALQEVIVRLRIIEKTQPLKDPREAGLVPGVDATSRADYLARLAARANPRLKNPQVPPTATTRDKVQVLDRRPPPLPHTPPPPQSQSLLADARFALDRFTARRAASGEDSEVLQHELADALDEACLSAVMAHDRDESPDREAVDLQSEAFESMDSYILEVAAGADELRKKKLAICLIVRGERRLRDGTGAVWQEAGQRFDWVTALDPTNANAFYLAGFCIFSLAKSEIEAGGDLTAAKAALLSAREYFESSSRLAVDRNEASELLKATDALIARCTSQGNDSLAVSSTAAETDADAPAEPQRLDSAPARLPSAAHAREPMSLECEASTNPPMPQVYCTRLRRA